MQPLTPPSTPPPARDLTDAEFAELDEALAATPEPHEPLDAVMLDGFLCGVLVQPVLLEPATWLPHVFDFEGRPLPDDVDPAWLERITTLVLRRHAALRRALEEEGWFDPLILEPEDGDDDAGDGPVGPDAFDADGYRTGYTPVGGAPSKEVPPAGPSAGAALSGPSTGPASTDPASRDAGSRDETATQETATQETAAQETAASETAADEAATNEAEADVAATAPQGADELRPSRVSQAVMPWVAGFELAAQVFPDLHELPDEEVMTALARLYRHLPAETDEERAIVATLDRDNPLTTLDDAMADLVSAVADLHDLTRERRYQVETIRREAPKVGRNEPCPCGSGRKFKHCHGAG